MRTKIQLTDVQKEAIANYALGTEKKKRGEIARFCKQYGLKEATVNTEVYRLRKLAKENTGKVTTNIPAAPEASTNTAVGAALATPEAGTKRTYTRRQTDTNVPDQSKQSASTAALIIEKNTVYIRIANPKMVEREGNLYLAYEIMK